MILGVWQRCEASARPAERVLVYLPGWTHPVREGFWAAAWEVEVDSDDNGDYPNHTSHREDDEHGDDGRFLDEGWYLDEHTPVQPTHWMPMPPGPMSVGEGL